MPQDLTPQLRTRLNRMEKWVGLFVTLALLLLLFGLAYYIYQVAQRKGWFLAKVPYHTYVMNAAGLREGDPVKLMGFDVGDITEIEAMGPYDYFNVYIKFRVREPYYGYIWTDSTVRVGSGDFLGNRFLELIKGSWGAATVLDKDGRIEGILDYKIKTNINHVPTENLRYVALTNGSKGYWLDIDEAPALTERLDAILEEALPNVLAITNQISAIFSNVTAITYSTDSLLLGAQPIVTNLFLITSNLSAPDGSLGKWLIPPGVTAQLEQTLADANSTVVGTRTNIEALAATLGLTLESAASLTSNLNAQVQANSLILSEISTLVVDTDEMVQGLKRHWLLKGAFGTSATNEFPDTLRPRMGGER